MVRHAEAGQALAPEIVAAGGHRKAVSATSPVPRRAGGRCSQGKNVIAVPGAPVSLP